MFQNNMIRTKTNETFQHNLAGIKSNENIWNNVFRTNLFIYSISSWVMIILQILLKDFYSHYIIFQFLFQSYHFKTRFYITSFCFNQIILESMVSFKVMWFEEKLMK